MVQVMHNLNENLEWLICDKLEHFVHTAENFIQQLNAANFMFFFLHFNTATENKLRVFMLSIESDEEYRASVLYAPVATNICTSK